MIKKFLFTISLSVLVMAPASQVWAAPSYGLNPTAQAIGYTDKQKNIEPIIATVVKGFLAATALFFFGLMTYAGLRWMTARGQEDLIERSRHTLQAAVLGLIIILASWGVTNFILSVFGSPYTSPPAAQGVAAPKAPAGTTPPASGCCEIMTNGLVTDCKENKDETTCYQTLGGSKWIKGSCFSLNECVNQAQVVCYPTGGTLCEGSPDKTLCELGDGCQWKFNKCIGTTDTTNCGHETDKDKCTLDPACGWVPADTPP